MASLSSARRKVLVVGAGAVGLRTAKELLRRRNCDGVALLSHRSPLHPSTCSVGAGGLWMPFHINHPHASKWAGETLDELLSFVSGKAGPAPAGDEDATRSSSEAASANDDENHDTTTTTNDNSPLVEVVPTVVLKREHGGPTVQNFPKDRVYEAGMMEDHGVLPEWSNDSRLRFQHLTTEMLSWQNIGSHRLLIPPHHELEQAGYQYAYLFYPPIVNAPAMLANMLQYVEERAEHCDVAGPEFESVEHMCETARSLGCDAVINCTGLGAAQIAGAEQHDDDDGEPQLIGARGVLLKYQRETCVRRREVYESPFGNLTNDAVILCEEEPWGSETEPCYLIPRGDTIVVGGSYLENDSELSIREEERKRLVDNARRLGVDVELSPVNGEWVGFRPYRSVVRCEIDTEHSGAGTNDGVTVVHNYGHGGSGWTVNVGAAKECVDLLLGPDTGGQ